MEAQKHTPSKLGQAHERLTTLTNSETFLLEWLGKEDSSAYGECKGRDLDVLVDLGLAEVGPMQPIYPTSRDFCRVSLTEAGWERRAALARAEGR